MKKTVLYNILWFCFFLFTFTSCEIIGDIFEAGVWVGIIIVVAVIIFLLWIVRKLF